jgi:hypothetical protein
LVTNPIGDTTSDAYYPSGLEESTTDLGGDITSYCYYYETSSCAAGAPAAGGAGNDLYTETLPISGDTTMYEYFPGGATEEVSSPGGSTTDGYDAMGDLTSEIYTANNGFSTTPNVAYTFYGIKLGTDHQPADLGLGWVRAGRPVRWRLLLPLRTDRRASRAGVLVDKYADIPHLHPI